MSLSVPSSVYILNKYDEDSLIFRKPVLRKSASITLRTRDGSSQHSILSIPRAVFGLFKTNLAFLGSNWGFKTPSWVCWRSYVLIGKLCLWLVSRLLSLLLNICSLEPPQCFFHDIFHNLFLKEHFREDRKPAQVKHFPRATTFRCFQRVKHYSTYTQRLALCFCVV